MKLEQLVIGGGLAIIFGVSVVAIVADDLFEDEYHDAPPIHAGIPAPHRDGREKIACNSCHVILPAKAGGGEASAGTPPIAFDAPTPASHKDGRDRMACQNCHEILPSKTGGGEASAGTPPIALGVAAPVSHNDGRDTMVCENCHKILPR